MPAPSSPTTKLSSPPSTSVSVKHPAAAGAIQQSALTATPTPASAVPPHTQLYQSKISTAASTPKPALPTTPKPALVKPAPITGSASILALPTTPKPAPVVVKPAPSTSDSYDGIPDLPLSKASPKPVASTSSVQSSSQPALNTALPSPSSTAAQPPTAPLMNPAPASPLAASNNAVGSSGAALPSPKPAGMQSVVTPLSLFRS